MNISELKDLWQKEKGEYLKSEVGSGVQRFVYEVFRCKELFGLGDGLKTTPQEKRSHEFLREESLKNGMADAVIFIDADIIIPVEVEKLSKAKSGEWQIRKYRMAFDKKYGILTDGHEWRFYYGEIEEEKFYRFNIVEMLSNPERFRTFWDEYIKLRNYYLAKFGEEVGQQKFELFEKEKFSVDKYREKFFRDITEIIGKLKHKMINANYFLEIKDTFEREKKATEIAYSYLIQFILYKTLVDNGFLEFSEEFVKKEKLIHEKLKNGSYNSILSLLESMSSKISKNIYKPFDKEQEMIMEQVKKMAYDGEENLLKASPFLDIFFFIREYHFENVQNDIFGAIYENYLKALYEEKNFGQYFTAPEVVNFMLEEIGYTKEEIKKRNHENISIIDPACGSGTFLYSAVREMMNAGNYSTEEDSKRIEEEIINNIFGLDIAEFPLYLAEMSILMKILPMVVNEKYNNPIDKKLKLFVTEDSVAEFVGEIGGKKTGTKGEQAQLGLGWQYGGFMRDDRDLDEMKQSLNNVTKEKQTIPRKRFDFVIGNPPYISYNECSKMGIKVFKDLKEKKSGVSLNNIYGWNLHSVKNNRKKYSPKPNLYAFFMALGFGLLKEGGKFCYIIPQTLLTAGDLDVVRYQLANEYTIEKLITFAGNLFVGRGTNQKKKVATSSLIIICTKKKPKTGHEVECLHFSEGSWEVEKVFDAIRSDREKYQKMIPQNLLKERVENWNFIKWDDDFLKMYEIYQQNSESMEVYYNHEKAEKRFSERFWFDIGYNIDEKKRLKEPFEADYFIPKTNALKFHLEENGYWRNERNKGDPFEIQLLTTNQGYQVLDTPFKVFWSYINPNHFYFCDKPLIWARNRYCAIASNKRDEILFLFSILNSKVVWTILSSSLKSDHEKSFLIALNSIKIYARPPLINTPKKEATKARIIALAEQMLDMEKQTLDDMVEIETLMQRFTSAEVEDGALILKNGETTLKAKIKSGMEERVEKALGTAQKGLFSEGFTLTELRELSAYDRKEQMSIKAEIDGLVEGLYGIGSEK